MFQLMMLMLVPTPPAAVDLPQGIILRDLPQGPMPVSDKTLYPTNYRCPAEEKRSPKDLALDRIRAKLGIPGVSATVVLPDGTAWTGVSGLADVGTEDRGRARRRPSPSPA